MKDKKFRKRILVGIAMLAISIWIFWPTKHLEEERCKSYKDQVKFLKLMCKEK